MTAREEKLLLRRQLLAAREHGAAMQLEAAQLRRELDATVKVNREVVAKLKAEIARVGGLVDEAAALAARYGNCASELAAENTRLEGELSRKASDAEARLRAVEKSSVALAEKLNVARADNARLKEEAASFRREATALHEICVAENTRLYWVARDALDSLDIAAEHLSDEGAVSCAATARGAYNDGLVALPTTPPGPRPTASSASDKPAFGKLPALCKCGKPATHVADTATCDGCCSYRKVGQACPGAQPVQP